MKEQFVTYEIALKLKELGFNKQCLGYFKLNGMEQHYYILGDMHNSGNNQLAPLWQQAIDFILTQYGLSIEFNVCNDAKFHYEILSWANKFFDGSICIDSKDRDEFYKSLPFGNKYIAREHAILEAIKLIEQK